MLVSVGRPLAARSDSDQPVKETDGSCGRALKREIPNPPYQGGKATERMPGGQAALTKLSRNSFGAFGAAVTQLAYSRATGNTIPYMLVALPFSKRAGLGNVRPQKRILTSVFFQRDRSMQIMSCK